MALRLFISTDVILTEEYDHFQRALLDIGMKTGLKIKMVKKEDAHITLKFLGDVKSEKIEDIVLAMERSVGGMQPIFGTLKGTGVFPSPQKPRVIWIGVEGAESLADIAESLDEELSSHGFKKENRDFIPHVTVGRVKQAGQGGKGRGRRGKRKPTTVFTPDQISQISALLEEYSNTTFGDIKAESIKLMSSKLTPGGPVYRVVKEVRFF